MLEVINRLQWYPEAIEGLRMSYEPVPTGPPTNSKRDDDLDELKVNILDDAPLQYGVDESYTLEVSDRITITANTTWGALNGLKTLQQLVIYKDGRLIIEGSVKISDYPLYSHRGVLIDSARNYLSLESIKENIDIMAMAKLNTLHWHLSDTVSWPLEVKAYPQMINDAYSPEESYSQQDVSNLVKYAYARGVRIVPEIELASHANAGWRLVDPKIISCGKGFWNVGDIATEPAPGQLDIAGNKTYEVAKTIFREVNQLFPDYTFHVGYDELHKPCSDFSNDVWEWYEQNGFGPAGSDEGYASLVQYWTDRSFKFLSEDNTTQVMMWEDLITNYAAKPPKQNSLIQVWLSVESIKNITSKGYDVILSPYDQYYLDCGFGEWVTNNPKTAGSWCDPYKTWESLYRFDPMMNLTESEVRHIKGAEVALWGEVVDSSNLVQKIWSRSAAFAEVYWSGNKDENGDIRVYDFTQRMFNFRQYLLALGYRVDPLAPQYCWRNPHACDISI
ncbi:woronin body major protein [Yamadazyma tenuis]|nr:woronin body major protein [Yamadazyma tenuis]